MNTTQSATTCSWMTHVLAIDDDPSMRQMLSDYLGDYDIRVTTLDSGREVADVMAREMIDLLILDLKLPGEDGMAITRRLRADSGLPIIMLTGRKDEADRVMGLELGADDYVTKPFSPPGTARPHPRIVAQGARPGNRGTRAGEDTRT
jgi:DNA-binding response OmpR family regulator